ncbi:nitroreductase [Candidatus Bathyarchaeota archaeon]|nr:MAG: nitroreductase [Candidatus Bathyarchaeota archaeon]
MNVFDAIRTRRSIRKYLNKPVEREKLSKILEAARLSPSAANRQPWRFIVVTDQKIKEELRAAYDEDWFVSAPVIIVGCALPSEAWVRSDGEEYWKVDLAIAMQNLILEAWELGLGTCWIGAFREDEVKRILGIPDEVRVVALASLGYPAEEKGSVTKRKPLEEIVSYNYW